MGTATAAEASYIPTPQGSGDHIGKIALVDITMSSSYATGGDTVDLSAIFPNSVRAGVMSGYVATYWAELVVAASDAPATAKIIAMARSDDAQVAATTDLSAVVFSFQIWGS